MTDLEKIDALITSIEQTIDVSHETGDMENERLDKVHEYLSAALVLSKRVRESMSNE